MYLLLMLYFWPRYDIQTDHLLPGNTPIECTPAFQWPVPRRKTSCTIGYVTWPRQSESAPNARPCPPPWLRSLYGQVVFVNPIRSFAACGKPLTANLTAIFACVQNGMTKTELVALVIIVSRASKLKTTQARLFYQISLKLDTKSFLHLCHCPKNS